MRVQMGPMKGTNKTLSSEFHCYSLTLYVDDDVDDPED